MEVAQTYTASFFSISEVCLLVYLDLGHTRFFTVSSLLLLQKLEKTMVVLSVFDQVIVLSVSLTGCFESAIRQDRGKENLLTQQRWSNSMWPYLHVVRTMRTDMMVEKAESVSRGSYVSSVHQGSLPLIPVLLPGFWQLSSTKISAKYRRIDILHCTTERIQFCEVCKKLIDLLNIQKCRGNLCWDNFGVCCSLNSRTVAILSLQIFFCFVFIFISQHGN